MSSGLDFAPEISFFCPFSSMYNIVGNPVTPDESGVASDSTSAVSIAPPTRDLNLSHAGLFAAQCPHPSMKNKITIGFFFIKSSTFFF